MEITESEFCDFGLAIQFRSCRNVIEPSAQQCSVLVEVAFFGIRKAMQCDNFDLAIQFRSCRNVIEPSAKQCSVLVEVAFLGIRKAMQCDFDLAIARSFCQVQLWLAATKSKSQNSVISISCQHFATRLGDYDMVEHAEVAIYCEGRRRNNDLEACNVIPQTVLAREGF